MASRNTESTGEGSAASAQFALTPAIAYEGIIDYKTTRGHKMYTSATAKLMEDLYDCNAEDLYAFLKDLREKSKRLRMEDTRCGNHLNSR